MTTKNLAKFIVAVVLTLSVALGSGIVAEEIGVSVTPSLYACTGHGGGGGC
ncbi:MAG: hypothetical protein AAF702_26025 [Chloroflexota bacterium]